MYQLYLKKISSLTCLTLLTLLLAHPVAAHHSGSNFDRDNQVQFVGEITKFTFRNPHVYLELETQNSDGKTEQWLIEGHSVTGARRLGWTSSSLQVGEQVTVLANPDRDQGKQFALLSSVQKSDGSFLYAFRKPADENVAKEVIKPSFDFLGTWELDLSSFNFLTANGQPPQDYHYTELGLEQRDQFSVDDNPALNCQTVGVPRMVVWPYGYNFSRDGDTLMITKEHENIRRDIFLNSALDELLDKQVEPTYIGVSVGEFETPQHLVVQSAGFSATPWGISSGLDSSTEKRVTEEYRLAEDGLSIEVSYTVEDSVYLTQAITVTGRYLKKANADFAEIPCDLETARRHISSSVEAVK